MGFESCKDVHSHYQFRPIFIDIQQVNLFVNYFKLKRNGQIIVTIIHPKKTGAIKIKINFSYLCKNFTE